MDLFSSFGGVGGSVVCCSIDAFGSGFGPRRFRCVRGGSFKVSRFSVISSGYFSRRMCFPSKTSCTIRFSSVRVLSRWGGLGQRWGNATCKRGSTNYTLVFVWVCRSVCHYLSTMYVLRCCRHGARRSFCRGLQRSS